jgi:hypothetical protein
MAVSEVYDIVDVVPNAVEPQAIQTACWRIQDGDIGDRFVPSDSRFAIA